MSGTQFDVLQKQIPIRYNTCCKDIGIRTARLKQDDHFGFNSQHDWDFGGGGREGTYLTFNEHKNLHFDNGFDVHMNSKSYEENNHGLGFVLVACFISKGQAGYSENSNHFKIRLLDNEMATMYGEHRGFVTRWPNVCGDLWMSSQWLGWGTNVKLSRSGIDQFKGE